MTAALVLGLAGCSRNTFSTPAVDRSAAIRAGPPLPVGQVWILDQSGPSPIDTTLRFAVGSRRTVLLRHGSPDNAVYAVVDIPAGAVTAAAGDSAMITIAPTPGRFGLTITTPGEITSALGVTFSYATHFQAPSDATVQYPTPARFEQSMGAAMLEGSGMIRFLPTTRPAADMMRFGVATPGTYVLAAPK